MVEHALKKRTGSDMHNRSASVEAEVPHCQVIAKPQSDHNEQGTRQNPKLLERTWLKRSCWGLGVNCVFSPLSWCFSYRGCRVLQISIFFSLAALDRWAFVVCSRVFSSDSVISCVVLIATPCTESIALCVIDVVSALCVCLSISWVVSWGFVFM